MNNMKKYSEKTIADKPWAIEKSLWICYNDVYEYFLRGFYYAGL